MRYPLPLVQQAASETPTDGSAAAAPAEEAQASGEEEKQQEAVPDAAAPTPQEASEVADAPTATAGAPRRKGRRQQFKS